MDLETYRESVTEMLETAREHRVRPVVLSTTVIEEDPESAQNRRLRPYNATLEELARQFEAPFIDLNAPFHAAIAAHRQVSGDANDWLTTDGVHLNAHGNFLMALVILTGLGIPRAVQEEVRETIRRSQAPAVPR
ncbi:MAG: hypothetical protein C4321_09530 [Chloroflexota bacterium]